MVGPTPRQVGSGTRFAGPGGAFCSRTRPEAVVPAAESSAEWPGGMLALQYRKNVLRYVWVRLIGGRFPRTVAAPGGFLRLTRLPEPQMPNTSWARICPLLSGICGSDLATVAGKSSIYLSAFTSFPFVPGHEVVGRVIETGAAVASVKTGDRVVLEPALGCSVRGFDDLCRPCRDGHYANCERVTEGDISAGIQTGYCRDHPAAAGARS